MRAIAVEYDPGKPQQPSFWSRTKGKLVGEREAALVRFHETWGNVDYWGDSQGKLTPDERNSIKTGKHKRLLQRDAPAADNYITGSRGEYIELVNAVIEIDPERQLAVKADADKVRRFLNAPPNVAKISVNLLHALPIEDRPFDQEERRASSESVNQFMLCLARHRVTIKRASLNYDDPALARRWDNLELDAPTAMFLIMCIRDEASPEYWRYLNKTLARAIRDHGLLPLVGLRRLKRWLQSEYNLIIPPASSFVSKGYGPDMFGNYGYRQRYDTNHGGAARSMFTHFDSVQACHDLMVAYLLHDPSPNRFSALTVDKLVELFKDDPSKGGTVVDNVTADVRQLGFEVGVVYAAIINATTDVMNDTTRSDANKTAAIAAVISLVSTGVSTASGFIPGPSEVGGAVSKVTDTVAGVFFDRVTARYTRRQEIARALVNEIVHRFNVLVLGEADSGSIPNLDLGSPPSDPELVPILVPSPNGYPVYCRPTAHDINLFKDTACNAVIVLCSTAGVTMEDDCLALSGMPKVSLRNRAATQDKQAEVQPPYDPSPALRAEIKKQFHQDDVNLWYDLVSGVARAMHWPVFSFMTYDSKFTALPGWSHQIKNVLQNPQNVQLQSLVEQLRDSIGEREKRKDVYPGEIAEKVRYFFIDPPRVTYLRSLHCHEDPVFD